MSEWKPHDLGMADEGEQVRFLNRNGYAGELELARDFFSEGDTATVERVSIGGWSSSYLFKEHGSQWFNTVMFEPLSAQTQDDRHND